MAFSTDSFFPHNAQLQYDKDRYHIKLTCQNYSWTCFTQLYMRVLLK